MFGNLFKAGGEQTSAQGGEQRESEKLDTKVVSRFRRHANPDKGANGLSLDSLNESGIEQAELIGADSKESGRAEKLQKTFHSPKQRAWETLRYMLDGAGKEEIKSYEKSELDAMAIPGSVVSDMVWKDKEKGVKNSYDEMIDVILTHPDSQKELELIAERMSHRLNVAQNTPHYLEPGDDVEIESITHGPVQEALLKKIIKLEGKDDVGFESVTEIGGAFKPGEGFEIETTLDNEGNQTKKLVLYRLDEKGVEVIDKKEYDVDWDEVKRLGENYRMKQVANEKAKMLMKKYLERIESLNLEDNADKQRWSHEAISTRYKTPQELIERLKVIIADLEKGDSSSATRMISAVNFNKNHDSMLVPEENWEEVEKLLEQVNGPVVWEKQE